MRKILLACLAFMIPYGLFAQSSVSPEVLGAAGTEGSGTGIQAAWTVGETVIETQTATQAILTQGFHQPPYEVVAVDDPEDGFLNVSVYPNPGSENLFVDLDSDTRESYIFVLTDLQGRQLLRNQASGSRFTQELETRHLPAGTYLLQVLREDGSAKQTFKVIRNL